MDEDKFALVEKIIKDVDNIMSKDAELYAFDIVPVDTNFRNKSPVLHLENCLGLESWCVKHVYMYCYSEIIEKCLTKSKRKVQRVTSVNSDRLTKLLNISLLLNPELNLLWNLRREMVLKSLLDKLLELQFSKLVLSRKPKCNDAFSYRKWILNMILNGEIYQNNFIESLVNEELSICERASDKSPNNYHSWNHRIWLINKLKSTQTKEDLKLLFIKEYDFSERFSSKRISDFSCFHYRQFCIKNIFEIGTGCWKIFEATVDVNLRKGFVRILASNFPKDAIKVSECDLLMYNEETLVNLLLSHTAKSCCVVPNNVLICKKLEVLFHEMILNNESLQFYRHHETLWYHRRFIVHGIITLIYNYFGLVRENGVLVKKTCKKCNQEVVRQKQAKICRYDSNAYSCLLFNILICHEKKFIEVTKDLDDYADRHEKYLKFVLGLNNLM